MTVLAGRRLRVTLRSGHTTVDDFRFISARHEGMSCYTKRTTGSPCSSFGATILGISRVAKCRSLALNS
jgi:hypothetical protein